MPIASTSAHGIERFVADVRMVFARACSHDAEHQRPHEPRRGAVLRVAERVGDDRARCRARGDEHHRRDDATDDRQGDVQPLRPLLVGLTERGARDVAAVELADRHQVDHRDEDADPRRALAIGWSWTMSAASPGSHWPSWTASLELRRGRIELPTMKPSGVDGATGDSHRPTTSSGIATTSPATGPAAPTSNRWRRSSISRVHLDH